MRDEIKPSFGYLGFVKKDLSRVCHSITCAADFCKERACHTFSYCATCGRVCAGCSLASFLDLGLAARYWQYYYWPSLAFRLVSRRRNESGITLIPGKKTKVFGTRCDASSAGKSHRRA